MAATRRIRLLLPLFGVLVVLAGCATGAAVPLDAPSPGAAPATVEPATSAPPPVPELPGGGHTLFPGRTMVALYGHPGAPALGVLGEQGVDASVQRARDLAARYTPLTGEPVVPAFEIIG